ncbi:hypothetical protein C8J57DRAFT_1218480 [Mycena rebaudengoi]|nr:hypothetical protein C8J57DRAFT_1218480 [Mycena rebaudengoi]
MDDFLDSLVDADLRFLVSYVCPYRALTFVERQAAYHLLHRIEKIVEPVKPQDPVIPTERAWRTLCHTLVANCTGPEYAQHVRAMTEYFRSRDPVEFTNLQAFLEYRRTYTLTDEDIAQPLLARCMEIAVAKAHPMNLVFMRFTHGMGGRKIPHYEALLCESLSIVMVDEGIQMVDAAQQWLEAIPYTFSGNTWWSQLTRYNLPGKPVNRKAVHLEGGGN